MKKTIATFVLGGLLTAGAFGLVYELPITSAAEKVAPGMTREVGPKAAGETSTQCIETTTPDGKSKTVDPKTVEATHCN
ncbi:hypothetical protein AXX12_15050 [Anaerosporomusa subterranea]|uniref:Uncharacterized protein n=1 Tax=Anaerosporomusa subterranea TaxID=1794912 RepID=A0A154BLP0_ANASB|nr:hypothetical protein [Anaerosporomusa subterranea]KYZ74897.1 hypothetical protein AXX12_15050 [Anaerosporomusa subterranea]